jgi:hypothetical protein
LRFGGLFAYFGPIDNQPGPDKILAPMHDKNRRQLPTLQLATNNNVGYSLINTNK